eukprot:2163564-Rhodomonas_salina.2
MAARFSAFSVEAVAGIRVKPCVSEEEQWSLPLPDNPNPKPHTPHTTQAKPLQRRPHTPCRQAVQAAWIAALRGRHSLGPRRRPCRAPCTAALRRGCGAQAAPDASASSRHERQSERAFEARVSFRT